MKITNLSMLRASGLIAITVFLNACGSGSGASTSENPITATPDASSYSGPPPATADIQSFKIFVWDNLAPDNRCGSCHDEDQTPRFARSDDINLAYAEINTVVDLNDPGSSLLVTNVAGGHNCWLPNDADCGARIESYLDNWAGDTVGSGGKEVELEAPLLNDPASSKNFPVDAVDFAATVYPLLTTYC